MSTSTQLSGRDESGRPILSVLAKRTYLFDAHGETSGNTDQVPLVTEPRYGGGGFLLEQDTDLWPFKPRTDVVVLGHAYNHRGEPRFSAGVSVGGSMKLVAVSGDRRCTMAHDGRILFSAPDLAERVPLSYALAYGGRDAAAEATYGNPVALLKEYLPPDTAQAAVDGASPFLYPRNPAGRGYLIEATRAALEALALPNLEHPEDLLAPERVAAGDTGRWPLQPVPASLGWLDYGAFPRAAWLGAVADHAPDVDATRVGEVRFGYCRPELLTSPGPDDPPPPLSFEGVNGASLGLRVPHLAGGETIELWNLSPRREALRLRLPRERPTLWVDGREGGLSRVERPVLHSVVIEPDRSSLTVVWRGSAPARRPYLPEELKAMPFAAEF